MFGDSLAFSEVELAVLAVGFVFPFSKVSRVVMFQMLIASAGYHVQKGKISLL